MHRAFPELDFVRQRHVRAFAVLLLALLWFSMLLHAPHARTLLVQGDNDDIMRWLLVKDWLAGQPWYDMRQYRVEPPEGLSMHWSRYLDAAIGVLNRALSLALPADAADRWTLILWPNLVLVALLALAARGTGRLLGPVAAIFAMLLVMTWMPVRGITFANGRIDHHNIQILLTSVVAMAMVLPGRALFTGGVAGLAAAFSLAIGLEMLLFVAAAGITLVVRAAFDAVGARDRLVWFCLALLGGAALFMAGQIPPAEWLVPQCDALSTPFLAIILIASASSLGAVATFGRVRHPLARLALVSVLAAAGVGLFADLLRPCLAGPYGMLPAEAQEFITTRISEALPGLVFATTRPLTFANVILPLFLVTVLATVFRLRNRFGCAAWLTGATDQMLVFAWLGLLGSLVQVRMNIIAAPALPFLAGYVASEMLARLAIRRNPAALALALLAAMATFAVQNLNGPALALASRIAGRDLAPGLELASFDKGCRNEPTLATLNALPPARVLTTLNLGAPMILTTHHSALSVPYQRGAHTFWNGSFPFRSEDLMLRAIRQSAPEYVVICRAATYDAEHAFALALKDGRLPAWLTPVSVPSDDLLVLRVVPDRLPARN